MGPAGSGKSSLALDLIGLGAHLVADDAVLLSVDSHGCLRARAPEAVRGLIEARGVGLLRAEALDEASVALVVDLARVETDRLPPERTTTWLGVTLPLLHKAEIRCFSVAVRQHVLYGRGA